MSTSDPQQIPFDGVRLRSGSTKNFDALVAALLADVGDKPVQIEDIAGRFDNWASYEREVRSHVGPSGFMLFASFNHGGWIRKAGHRPQGAARGDRQSVDRDHDAAPRRHGGTVRARRTPANRGGRRIAAP